MRPVISMILVSCCLAGCASLTKEECNAGDWAQIGEADAIRGRTTERFANHIKACERYNILPDRSVYDKGYRIGLVKYCKPANGFRVGRNGLRYKGICPAGSEPGFLNGYQRGYDLHQIELNIAGAKNNLQEVQAKIWETQNIETDDTAERRENMQTLHRLQRDQDRLYDEIDRLGEQRDRALIDADRFLVHVSPAV